MINIIYRKCLYFMVLQSSFEILSIKRVYIRQNNLLARLEMKDVALQMNKATTH